MRFYNFSLSASVFAALAFSAAAKADTLSLIQSSASYPGYDSSNATDTGANKLLTDFAGNGTGGGENTFLVFSIAGGPVDTVSLYDRTSSGGTNGSNAEGLYDYTTAFTLYFDQSVPGGGSIPVATYSFTKPDPTVTGISSFFFTATFAPVSADIVEYAVDTANGANPGLADFELTGSTSATPEPGSLVLLGTGVLGLAGMVRRKISAK